jgi:phosphoserine phosphatase
MQLATRARDCRTADRIVVNVQGQDVPGICSELAAVVAEAGAELVDMRQTVVRGRLRLALELIPNRSTDGLFMGIIRTSRRLGLAVDFDAPAPAAGDAGVGSGASAVHGRPTSYVLTLSSEEDIGPLCLQQMAATLAERQFSVEKVTRLSARSMRCLELGFATTQTVGTAEMGELRRELYALGTEAGVDVALQADSVLRRAKRVVVMDMDSTLIQQEVIDELARYAGVFEQVKEITHRAMSGELDFNQSLEQRCALLKGTPEDVFDKVIANLVYTQGAHTLCRSLKRLGYRLAVISGGFRRVAQHVALELGIDLYYANELEVDGDGRFTGRTVGPIVNAQRKADLLVTIAQKEGVTLAQTAAIGDGSNDTLMLGVAGLGIAFNAKPAVQRAASFRINQRNLSSTLYLLGFSEEEQVELAGKGKC